MYKTKKPQKLSEAIGAEDEARTRDPNLGKVMLYQLSYFRMIFKNFLFPRSGVIVSVWDCKGMHYF